MRPELTVEQVILIHDSMVDAPVTDRGKLESGVRRAFHGMGGQYFYVSIWAQTAALIHGIAAAHGFFDGNKRTAWTAGMTLLELNGVRLRRIPDEETANYMVEITEGLHTIDQIALTLAGYAD
ncbi:toxin Doc [Curtobacterium citreum]|uniref:Type II toxin-antitoxin system death-on-curing family toxin n=1 Tax=Curtobacterium citreum TaxID=2036 RepID=A0ABT2HDJ3_9MICO|nr:type II toxin-antitoxin system death-on-curing family toxin [Curtobacterium citreum]MCS6521323.1 type II toxin-antitoxin system death-on-curing family toxin [Curtobacterium citreum]TQJ28181.1 death-on-curing protein [Curtobacterium citreum]GGL77135.1 toxin Doc [Curtobacterium citreum]